MPIMPKLIYLAKRNPKLTRAAFTPRWRQHGALGMSRPRWVNIHRYVHCDAFPGVPGAPDLDGGYDGIGLIWHKSPEARLAHRTDRSDQAIMEADEHEVFAEPVVNFSTLAEEKLVHEAGGGPYKLFRFIARPASLAAGLFVRGWRTERTPLFLDLCAGGGKLKRLVQNFPLPPERPEGWGLRVDCVEELWFANLADLAEVHRAVAADALLRAADAQLAQQTLCVATNEIVLYRDGKRLDQ